MTLTDQAMEYARTHLQGVRICWLNKRVSICEAPEAVVLCSDPVTARKIVGVVAQDRRLEGMLHSLMDSE